MKQVVFFTIGLFAIVQICIGQAQPAKKEIYSKEFAWTITIPENFENVNPDEWQQLQNKGKEAIEKTYEGKVEDNTKTIFVFKADQFNYFEANYQPFDTAKDGNYLETFNGVNEMLYGTFKAQMPDMKIDSVSSLETISGLLFHTFKIKIYLPNKMTLDFTMYSRLFDKKEFTVNIMTVDDQKRKILENAWKSSRFGK